jgi:hypothetical protein
MASQELIDAVKAHALRNYNRGGWDVVVECWSDEEIAAVLDGTDSSFETRPAVTSLPRALKRFRDIVSICADRQADAVNSAF